MKVHEKYLLEDQSSLFSAGLIMVGVGVMEREDVDDWSIDVWDQLTSEDPAMGRFSYFYVAETCSKFYYFKFDRGGSGIMFTMYENNKSLWTRFWCRLLRKS